MRHHRVWPVWDERCSNLGKRHCRQLGQFGDEPVLEFRIAGFTGRPFLSKVMPIAAADQRSRLVGDGQPALSALAGVEVNRSPWTTHPGACPTGIDRIAQDPGPASRNREGERHDLELALGVGTGRIPGALFPIDIAQ